MGVSGFISRVDKKSGTTLKLWNISRSSVTQHSATTSHSTVLPHHTAQCYHITQHSATTLHSTVLPHYTAQCYHIAPAQVIIEEIKKWIMLQKEAFRHMCIPKTRSRINPNWNSLNLLISNCRRVLNVVCFLLGNFPPSELYMPTFRNTLFHLHR